MLGEHGFIHPVAPAPCLESWIYPPPPRPKTPLLWLNVPSLNLNRNTHHSLSVTHFSDLVTLPPFYPSFSRIAFADPFQPSPHRYLPCHACALGPNITNTKAFDDPVSPPVSLRPWIAVLLSHKQVCLDRFDSSSPCFFLSFVSVHFLKLSSPQFFQHAAFFWPPQ